MSLYRTQKPTPAKLQMWLCFLRNLITGWIMYWCNICFEWMMHMWLGKGNKTTLVRVRKTPWFHLKVNKHVMSEVTGKFFFIIPDHSVTLTLTKRVLKCIPLLLLSGRSSALCWPISSQTETQNAYVMTNYKFPNFVSHIFYLFCVINLSYFVITAHSKALVDHE